MVGYGRVRYGMARQGEDMEKLNVAAVIAVRMSSQRLPGKPLVSYHPSGKNNLACLTERVLSSRHNQTIIIATSTDKTDDPIATWVQKTPAPDWYDRSGTGHFALYRGDLENVVKRFDSALQTHAPNTDYVWRVMADCPLVDVGLLDWRLDILSRNKADMLTILPPEPTYAAQASVWSRDAWDYCAKMSSGSLLQHPGEYLCENHAQFKTLHEIGPENVYYQNIRTELDTPEDLEFFRKVWSEGIHIHDLPAHAPDTYKTLEWLSSRPDIVNINAHIEEKTKSTHLHGHHRARRYVCKECDTVLAHKVNDRLDIACPKCGTVRQFYV